jgi:acetoin utilization deacetylase AcuC-like enzyme
MWLLVSTHLTLSSCKYETTKKRKQKINERKKSQSSISSIKLDVTSDKDGWLQLFNCFFVENYDGDFISLRSGVDNEEDEIFQDAEGEDESASQMGRSFSGTDSKEEIVVRKSFPESWIFDGDLALGYKNLIHYY